MSTSDKDGRITQALGDLIECLGMAMNEQILEQVAAFDALLDEAISRYEGGRMSITDFILARVAEDEATARGAIDDHPDWYHESHGQVVQWAKNEDGTETWSGLARLGGSHIAEHVARHDPARVLAECEAKRTIVGEWDGWDGQVYDGWTNAAQIVLTHLAAIWSDHADYEEGWR